MGLFKFAMTLLSVQLVEDPKWGRRPLLLLGTSGMTVLLPARPPPPAVHSLSERAAAGAGRAPG